MNFTVYAKEAFMTVTTVDETDLEGNNPVEEEERLNRLIRALLEENRVEDLERLTSDRKYQEMLYKEFHI